MFADTVRCIKGTACYTSDGSYIDNGAAIPDVVQLCAQTSKSPIQVCVQYIIPLLVRFIHDGGGFRVLPEDLKKCVSPTTLPSQAFTVTTAGEYYPCTINCTVQLAISIHCLLNPSIYSSSVSDICLESHTLTTCSSDYLSLGIELFVDSVCK